MAKIINKTKCPTDLLKRIIEVTGKLSGATTTGVYTVIRQGRIPYSRGIAWECDQFHTGDSKWRKTNGGYFEVWLPKMITEIECLTPSERFIGIVAHEWSHIKDYQDRHCVDYRTWTGKRRQTWCNRPWEIRAIAVAKKSMKSVEEDLIIELGIYLEDNCKIKTS